MELIPVINVETFDELRNRLAKVEPYLLTAFGGSGWVQLDICDGTFTKNTSWHDAADLLSLETTLKIEVHLMITNAEERLDDWLIFPVKRIIFHLEAVKDPYIIIDKCRKAGKEVGIAIGPDISWTQLTPFVHKVDLFQILTVYPGLAGQELKEECLQKITYLKQNCPDCKIEVDGGVNKDNAKKVADAGADIINVANAIFSSDDIGKAIGELKKF